MYTTTHWCSSELKPIPAQCYLENYLQHPKKSYLSDIWNGMILTFRCTKWYGTHLTNCAKKHKKVWKSWKGNTTLQSVHHWCSANLQQFYPLYTSIIFLETEFEILGLGCERKHDLIHQCKVSKAYKFVLYMSKQSIFNLERQINLGDYFCISIPKRWFVSINIWFLSLLTDLVCYEHI